MSWYGFQDKITTSPAERARNAYKSAIEKTEDDLQSIREDLEVVRNMVRNGSNSYYSWGGSGDESKGLFVISFEAAVRRWSSEMDALIGLFGTFAREVAALESNLAIMNQRKITLDRMCEEEDARKREYTEAELPF